MCNKRLALRCTVCSLVRMNHELLNKVAELLRSNGITPTKHLVFSACLKSLIDAGIDTRTAFDFVLGAGAFERFAGDLYAALRG